MTEAKKRGPGRPPRRAVPILTHDMGEKLISAARLYMVEINKYNAGKSSLKNLDAKWDEVLSIGNEIGGRT